jgi:hypothetical protein
VDHGDKQVGKKQQRDDPDDECSHEVLLEVIAKAHVKSAHDKKENHGSCENEVAHRFSFGCSQKRE